MSRNGSGVYEPSATGYPAVASTTIESAKYNAVIADIATALTLSIAANGETTITANIPLAGYKITGLGNASADTDALNRVTADARYAALAGATFTGAVVFSGTAPEFKWYESDAAADEKYWRAIVTGGNWYLQALLDDLSTGTSPIALVRTGTTVDSIAMTATAFTVNAINVTPTSGSFTAELADASVAGNVLATGTAYWRKVGNLVTIQLRGLLATTTATSLYVRAIPAALQPALTGTNSQCFLVPGFSNGTFGPISLKIPEGTAYWFLTAVTAFTSGSASKGIGENTSAGVTVTYMVSD
jgi:hypothetical protein